MYSKKLDYLAHAAGWVMFVGGFMLMFYQIIPHEQPATGPVVVSLFIMMGGLWMVEMARFRAATRPVARKGVICGLGGQDWQFTILVSQGRILAPMDHEERVLDIAPIRITRPDDMPQFHWSPVRRAGSTNGLLIGAKILGKVYLLPQAPAD